jgi:hypothetical protein
MIWQYSDRFGYPAWCDIEIHLRPDGKRVFLVTEFVYNPARRVTNNPIKLANEVKDHYRLQPREVIWIDHYPERLQGSVTNEWLTECFELLQLSANERGEFTAAKASRLTTSQVADLISGELDVSALFASTEVANNDISENVAA